MTNKNLGIRKVKTLHGLMWGVVDLGVKDFVVNGKVKHESKEIDVIEYKKNKEAHTAMFSFTQEGFDQAVQLKNSL